MIGKASVWGIGLWMAAGCAAAGDAGEVREYAVARTLTRLAVTMRQERGTATVRDAGTVRQFAWREGDAPRFLYDYAMDPEARTVAGVLNGKAVPEERMEALLEDRLFAGPAGADAARTRWLAASGGDGDGGADAAYNRDIKEALDQDFTDFKAIDRIGRFLSENARRLAEGSPTGGFSVLAPEIFGAQVVRDEASAEERAAFGAAPLGTVKLAVQGTETRAWGAWGSLTKRTDIDWTGFFSPDFSVCYGYSVTGQVANGPGGMPFPPRTCAARYILRKRTETAASDAGALGALHAAVRAAETGSPARAAEAAARADAKALARLGLSADGHRAGVEHPWLSLAEWHPSGDLQKVLQEAVAAGRPVLLYVYQDRCPACQLVEEGSLDNEAFLAFAREKNLFLVARNLVLDREGLQPFRRAIRATPTFLLMDPATKRIVSSVSQSVPLKGLMQGIEKGLSRIEAQ